MDDLATPQQEGLKAMTMHLSQYRKIMILVLTAGIVFVMQRYDMTPADLPIYGFEVGGITEPMRAGRIVIPDQIIDYSWGRAHSFYDHPDGGALDHVDFTTPYDATLADALARSADENGLDPAVGGVHGVTQGPRLETAAEIERMARDGCDIVGMTGMPEAALAREAGLDYACCAVVVNKAAGRSGGTAIHAEIEKTLARGMANIEAILDTTLARL